MSDFLIVIRFFLSLIFLVSAVTKVMAPAELYKSIKNYRILPQQLVKISGWSLVIIELFLSVFLLLGWQPLVTGIASGILIITFIVAAAKVIIRKQVTSCGCFGLLYKEKIGRSTIIRDFVILLISVSIVIWGQRLSTLPVMLKGASLTLFITALIILALFIFVLLLVVWKTITLKQRGINVIRSPEELESINRSNQQLRDFINNG